jgi:hypothetical protein
MLIPDPWAMLTAIEFHAFSVKDGRVRAGTNSIAGGNATGDANT